MVLEQYLRGISFEWRNDHSNLVRCWFAAIMGCPSILGHASRIRFLPWWILALFLAGKERRSGLLYVLTITRNLHERSLGETALRLLNCARFSASNSVGTKCTDSDAQGYVLISLLNTVHSFVQIDANVECGKRRIPARWEGPELIRVHICS